MKPYFAKYRPIEGEIKVGDRIGFDNGAPGKVEEIKGNILWIEDKEGWPEELLRYEVDKCKKVQLFLCTKWGIKSGDNVYHDSHGYGIANEKFKDNFSISKFNWTNLVKVIGPISPEATWVKEGDEFGEEEIKESLYWMPNGGFYDGYKKGQDMSFATDEGHSYIICYRIKGSCGHFH